MSEGVSSGIRRLTAFSSARARRRAVAEASDLGLDLVGGERAFGHLHGAPFDDMKSPDRHPLGGADAMQ